MAFVQKRDISLAHAVPKSAFTEKVGTAWFEKSRGLVSRCYYLNVPHASSQGRGRRDAVEHLDDDEEENDDSSDADSDDDLDEPEYEEIVRLRPGGECVRQLFAIK